MSNATLTTYSMWDAFRNCRKLCEWRYIEELVPIRTDKALSFGALIHKCLGAWYDGRGLSTIRSIIDDALPEHDYDESQRATWHRATAMMTGYVARYPAEPFDVIAIEEVFESKIVNPATERASRMLAIAGKIDGLVRMKDTGEYYLLEHKTASQVNSNYLDKLWSDLQITLYAHYIAKTSRINVAGVIYNILVKTRLQQSRGETQAEFDERRTTLAAKSVSGKSSAVRKRPESDEEFQTRLAAKYSDVEMFHREILYIPEEQFAMMREDLWELSQQFLDAKRRGAFYRNTSHCFACHHPCAYLPLCQSGGSSIVKDNHYETRPPHEELLAVADTTEEVF